MALTRYYFIVVFFLTFCWGLVPSYSVVDVNASIRFTQSLMVRVNLNNLAGNHYFTKRPSMYPGPGVWSSDGRTVNVTVALKV